jgi:ABC-type multidrug transport system ATPase subunit
LIGELELVILDELTANLDPISRVKFLERIKKLHREYDMNLLISTHALTELEKVCDQVAAIDQGVVRYEGKIEELVTKHLASEYAATVSESEPVGGEIKKYALTRIIRTDVGDKMVVKTDDMRRLEDDVISVVRKNKLVAIGPQCGILEAAYRRVMEQERNE